MESQAEWLEKDAGFARGAARAEQRPEVNAFVILTFGPDATADDAFECIVAAMRFGKIAIRCDEANQALVRALRDDGRARFTPFVALPFDAFGVMAVRSSAVKPPG